MGGKESQSHTRACKEEAWMEGLGAGSGRGFVSSVVRVCEEREERAGGVVSLANRNPPTHTSPLSPHWAHTHPCSSSLASVRGRAISCLEGGRGAANASRCSHRAFPNGRRGARGGKCAAAEARAAPAEPEKWETLGPSSALLVLYDLFDEL